MVTQSPELQDVSSIARAPNGYYFYYRSSSEEAQAAAPHLRSSGCPLVCWWDDDPIPKVTTYELGTRYRDAILTHSH